MDDYAIALGVSEDSLKIACDLIRTQVISCVVIHDEAVVHTADGRGVAPLLELYNKEREKLKDSCIVDRIIGKAAAMILQLGEVKSVYGEVMSVAARDYLTKQGIPFRYGRCVEVISGQSGSGICPIESSILDIDDPVAGLAAMTRRMTELRGSSA